VKTYKSGQPGDGANLGTFIFEFRDGVRGDEVLHMLASTMPETVSDTIVALQRAYREGREDRSKEILGDEGIAAGGAEVRRHRQRVAVSPEGRMLGGGLIDCSCGGIVGGVNELMWQKHVAYAVLQAAAREAS
jgi:hypothetical protein